MPAHLAPAPAPAPAPGPRRPGRAARDRVGAVADSRMCRAHPQRGDAGQVVELDLVDQGLAVLAPVALAPTTVVTASAAISRGEPLRMISRSTVASSTASPRASTLRTAASTRRAGPSASSRRPADPAPAPARRRAASVRPRHVRPGSTAAPARRWPKMWARRSWLPAKRRNARPATGAAATDRSPPAVERLAVEHPAVARAGVRHALTCHQGSQGARLQPQVHRGGRVGQEGAQPSVPPGRGARRQCRWRARSRRRPDETEHRPEPWPLAAWRRLCEAPLA